MNINWILLALMVLGVIILFKKYQEQPEEGLILKSFGYSFLGAFQFRLKGFPLPLGFLIYASFFRPKTNITIKKGAATFGLGLLFMTVFIPVVENSYFERNREVEVTSTTNFYKSNLMLDWKKIKRELDIKGEAMLENFNLEYQPDGKMKDVSYDVITNNGGRYIYYSIKYWPEKSQYLVMPNKLGQWVHYKRLVNVDRFFEVFQKIKLTSLKAEKKYAYYMINCVGQFGQYDNKETKALLLEEEKFKPLSQQQFPIQGFLIRVTGMVDISNSKNHDAYEGYVKKVFIFQ